MVAEAPEVDAKILPDPDWNELCHASCSTLLGGVSPTTERQPFVDNFSELRAPVPLTPVPPLAHPGVAEHRIEHPGNFLHKGRFKTEKCSPDVGRLECSKQILEEHPKSQSLGSIQPRVSLETLDVQL